MENLSNEKIHFSELNINFKNKFEGEYFKIVDNIDNNYFEDDIYVSNYGEVYNKSQDRLFDYENSTINLRIKNGITKGISRWNLTTNVFDISNTEYETRRRLKKLSYGYVIQNAKQFKTKIEQPIIIKKKQSITKDFSKNKEKTVDKITDSLNDLELELYKYKFIYSEILQQKNNLEIKIEDLENKIKIKKEINENKYKNTIIYMIRPKHNNFYMYVGHTLDKERRLKEHIRATVNDNKKLYKTIRETGGWEHWEMIEISTYNCKCKEDALKIEQEWCEKLRPNLNSNSPFA
jgi:predicted GIY-YIG superfamily endonuclease